MGYADYKELIGMLGFVVNLITDVPPVGTLEDMPQKLL